MKSFSVLLNQFLAKESGSFDVLVLKGFHNDVLREMVKTFPHVMGILPFDNQGLLDLPLILNSYKDITGCLIRLKEGDVKLLDFESFCQLALNTDLNETGKRFLILENNLLNEYPNQSNCTADDFEDLIHSDKDIPDDSPFYQFYSNASSFRNQVLIQYIDGFADEFENITTLKLFHPSQPAFETTPSNTASANPHVQFQQLNSEYLSLKIDIFNGKAPGQLYIDSEETIKQQKSAYLELQLLASVLHSLDIKASFSLHESSLSTVFRPELTALLKQYWNSDTFRSLYFYKHPQSGSELIEVSQAAIAEDVIQQFENGRQKKYVRDILLTAPTGSGKSLLFQLPAMYIAEKYKAVTIVISPLIALMKDQVIALNTERNYPHAAFVNSELSVIEREEVILKVHAGDISILYLSPELLLSQDLNVFLGMRELGLLVIDEAHLVTTWGRDFRTDYWYLGNFIRKARRYFNYKFPVLAVTATAVFGGPNDMVFETIASLYLENPRIFIGQVTRDDITFDITQLPIKSWHGREKLLQTATRICQIIDTGQKTIVYCPWVSHLSPIRDAMQPDHRGMVGLYFGGLNKTFKNETYEHFKSNQIKTIICTKAFGMGVDIDDITTIYHHAPSGHLADYVQEIGRVARRSDLQGVAITDFNIQDLKFTKILYSFSGIKQFQLQYVLNKILKIYNTRKNQNLQVSINDFQYIFKEEDADVEQKVKSSLILLEKDLQAKYGYNIILARPKNLFTAVYARVNEADVKKFTTKYAKLVRHIPQPLIEAKGQKVFALNLDRIWTTHFSELSFPSLRKAYFDKTLFKPDGVYVSPQIRIAFSLNYSANETYIRLAKNFDFVASALNLCGTDFFSTETFETALQSKFDNALTASRIAELILSVYSSPVDARRKKEILEKPECFIQQKKADKDFLYRTHPSEYLPVRTLLKKRYDRMFADAPDKERNFQFFIPVNDDKNIGMLQLAYVLEAFSLATFVIGGGEKPGVFIRINDVVKLSRISKRGYTNHILTDIERRQKTSLRVMEYFFTQPLTNSQRWQFIEKYFLGSPASDLIGEETETKEV